MSDVGVKKYKLLTLCGGGRPPLPWTICTLIARASCVSARYVAAGSNSRVLCHLRYRRVFSHHTTDDSC